MRQRSITGPLMLLLIGGFFLWKNLHPDWAVFDTLARYWPFILIAWGTLRLVEIVIFRRRVSSFTGGEVCLIVLLCVAGTVIWHAHNSPLRFNGRGLEIFGEEYDYPVSANAPSAGMKRIVFENPRGNVKIIGGDNQEITVTGRKLIRAWSRRDADASNNITPIEIVPQGDRLLIRTNQDKVPDSQRIADDIEVAVPKGVTVEARAVTGDYEVTGVTGEVELNVNRSDVRLARIGGDVRLQIGRSDLIRTMDLGGKLDVQGRGNELDLENIAGQVTINGAYSAAQFKGLAKPLQFEGARNTELHVQGVPGRIDMTLGEFSASGVTGPFRLIARSRDVKLEQFTHEVEIETERGDILLIPSLPMAKIEARSGAGKIDLVLPEKAVFDLQAVAERGEAYNGWGTAIRQERDGRSATLKGRVGDGPSVNLTANHGAVTVRKEGSEAPDPQEDGAGKRRKALRDLKDSEVKM